MRGTEREGGSERNREGGREGGRVRNREDISTAGSVSPTSRKRGPAISSRARLSPSRRSAFSQHSTACSYWNMLISSSA